MIINSHIMNKMLIYAKNFKLGCMTKTFISDISENSRLVSKDGIKPCKYHPTVTWSCGTLPMGENIWAVCWLHCRLSLVQYGLTLFLPCLMAINIY